MYVSSAKEPYCIALLNCCIWIPTDALPIWETCGYEEDGEAPHQSTVSAEACIHSSKIIMNNHIFFEVLL